LIEPLEDRRVFNIDAGNLAHFAPGALQGASAPAPMVSQLSVPTAAAAYAPLAAAAPQMTSLDDGLSSQAVLNYLVSKELTTHSSATSLVGSLSFDRAFLSLTNDELLVALLNGGLIRGYDDLASLKSALPGRGVNLANLRPDGMLTALATARNGSLLGTDTASMDAVGAKAALSFQFAVNPYPLLDVFTTRELLGLFYDSIAPAAGVTVDRFHALAAQEASADNISTMHHLWLRDTVGNQNTPTPQSALQATAAMPDGERSMHLSNYLTFDGFGSTDMLPYGYIDPTTSSGAASEFFMIWMDRWEQLAKARVQNFFTQYKNLGGKLDYLIMDVEDVSLSYWGVQAFDRRVNQQVPASRNVWQAIQADPRWNAVKAELKAAGLTDSDLSIANISRWDPNGKEVAIWNGVMEARFAGYLNRAVYEPLKALFPNVKVANYGSYLRSTTLPAAEYYVFGESSDTIGSLIGNHQSKELYGYHTAVYTEGGALQPDLPFDLRIKKILAVQNMDGYGKPGTSCLATLELFEPVRGLKAGDTIYIENRGQNWIDPQYTGKWKVYSISADGLTVKYLFTINSPTSVPIAYDLSPRYEVFQTAFLEIWRPYNAFVADMKLVRTQVATSTVPLLPWISDRDWLLREEGKDYTYHAEAIFHTALAGAEDFLWWKSTFEIDPANTSYWSGVLKELDPLVGFSDRKTITYTAADWSDGYVLTGMESLGRRVYRLTPDPNLPISNRSSGANVIFQIGSKTVTIPNAAIYTPANPTSTLGYWIVQYAGVTQLKGSVDQIMSQIAQDAQPRIVGSVEGVSGQPMTFSIQLNSALFPPTTLLNFNIDWNGDGNIDQTLVGANGMQFTGTYASSGVYQVSVSASIQGSNRSLDGSGGAALPGAVGVGVASALLRVSNPNSKLSLRAGTDPSLTNLVFIGDSGNDLLLVSESAPGQVNAVWINDQGGLVQESFSNVTGKVVAIGGDGDDTFYAGGNSTTLPVAFYGGNGNDLLLGGGGGDYIEGGAGDDTIWTFHGVNIVIAGEGNDLVLGGSDNDIINGNDGRDLIVGDRGTDTISGDAGEDLLIGGQTSYSTNFNALMAVMAEWTSARSYATRLANISGNGTGPRLNGDSYLIKGQTVQDDNAVDTLLGGSEYDWFVYTPAEVPADRVGSESAIVL
jgi:Ca2+-binding RTX toxin-like protein